LAEAFRIAGRPGVAAAFPGWNPRSLKAAVRAYARGGSAVVGRPVRVDRADVRRRLAALPAEMVLKRVAELLAASHSNAVQEGSNQADGDRSLSAYRAGVPIYGKTEYASRL
jgi:hypothetical protein